ncbi:MAG: hypothetical protein PHX04_04695 [Bacilli bacterium]|nr:hypothetical protein [Bacilli bacterium]
MECDDIKKSLIFFLKEANIELDEIEWEKIINLNDIREIQLLLNDVTIENIPNWIDMLIEFGNDSLAVASLCDILRVPYLRENDEYVSFIMSEEDFFRRQNLIRALTNLKVLGNFELFRFIYNISDKDKQRRIVAILEFELGYNKFKDVPLRYVTADELNYTLTRIEESIIDAEKVELEELSKRFIENPSTENATLLAQYQKKLDEIITHHSKAELSMALPEVSGTGNEPLTFKP